MEESKYSPLNEEEFIKLKEVVDSITTHIPTHQANYIWSSFNAVKKTNERQPCSCGSSASHWGRALGELRVWVKERE
jgi:hypothetical protein